MANGVTLWQRLSGRDCKALLVLITTQRLIEQLCNKDFALRILRLERIDHLRAATTRGTS